MKPQGETGLNKSHFESTTEAVILTVRIQLIKSTKILPQQSTAVSINLDECNGSTGPWLLEPDMEFGAVRAVYGVTPPGIPAEQASGASDKPNWFHTATEVRLSATGTRLSPRNPREG